MNEQPVCAHLMVKRFTVGNECRTFKEEWRCNDCGLEFFSTNFGLYSGEIQIMEPYATLRDQFAMAAMQGIITQGTMFGDRAIAKVSYEMADYMMEARKQ